MSCFLSLVNKAGILTHASEKRPLLSDVLLYWEGLGENRFFFFITIFFFLQRSNKAMGNMCFIPQKN